LVEGRAIQIHPLVCTPYNADFDGDQMAVHVPLSAEAQAEARILMLSSHNILDPKDGRPVVTPTQDVVLGCYYLTLERPGSKGEGKAFVDRDEVLRAYDLGEIDLHARITVRHDGRRMTTTAGRLRFNEILPPELGYQDRVIDRKALNSLVAELYRRFGAARTAVVLDAIKQLGFSYATRAGTTIAISDIEVPAEKAEILTKAEADVERIAQQYRRGLLSNEQRYEMVTGASRLPTR
jgi:DNA-directed RNA polymerase subunit beta'